MAQKRKAPDKPKKKPERLTERDLIAIVDAEIADSLGRPGSKLSKDRQEAIQYYNGEATGDLSPPEGEGRSRVVSSDTLDTIEWIMPTLMDIFTSGDDAVVFEPESQEDEAAATLRTEWVNYVFHRQNNGFVILHNFFKDALLQRLGTVKTWWDSSEDVTTEEYEGQTDTELAMLMQDEEVEIVAADKREEVLSGQPVALYDIKVKRSKDNSKVCIENVPPEEFLFSRNSRSSDTMPAAHHRVAKTVSELRAAGYKNIDQLPTGNGGESNDTEVIQRYNRNDENSPQANSTTLDESMRMVWITESYLKVDWNGDGIAEWRKVVKCGTVLLENEEVDEHVFSTITPIIMPHELVGKSVADLVADLQRIRTALLRQMLDNQYIANNQTLVIDETKGVNIDDVLDRRIGGVIRTKDTNAVRELGASSYSSDSITALEYMDRVKENRTGITKYNQGLDSNSLNKTATGINAIMNAAQMRIKLIARVFAETGVKDIFRRVLKLSSQYQTKSKMVRLRNQWVEIDPREWKTQYDMSINVGLGTGNKDQIATHLMNILQVQKEGLQIGITTPQNIYTGAKKLAENLGFKDGGIFFTDPSTQQPQQPQPDPQVQADMAKLEATKQESQAKLEAQKEKDAAQLELNRQIEAEKLASQERIELAKIQSNERIELIKLRASHSDTEEKQPEGDLSELKNIVEGMAKDNSAVLAHSLAMIAAPKTTVMSRQSNGDLVATQSHATQ